MSADNGEVQTCFFNRKIHFDSFQSKRIVLQEHIKFSIVKASFNCFELVNKRLDIYLNKSVSKSTDSERFKKDTTENFNNGKFSISTRRTETRNALLQRRRNNGSSSRRDTTSRKKPRFI